MTGHQGAPDLPLRIERATMRAWPSRFSQDIDGWILRVDAGYTGRANSVTVLRHDVDLGAEDLEAGIRRCELRYAAAGLPARFRLPEIGKGQELLDAELAGRGYARISETLVQVCPIAAHAGREGASPPSEARAEEPRLQPAESPSPNHRSASMSLPREAGSSSSRAAVGIQIEAAGLEAWMTGFRHLTDQDASSAERHAGILARIEPPSLRLLARSGETLLGCGLGVRDGDLLGLFDFYVAVGARRRGVGSGLVGAMLDWGRRSGARWAYLQVVEENAPAQALYAGFGFSTLYRYGYRLQLA